MATPSIFDVTLAESTLFELYRSQGYDELLTALKIAQDNVIKKIERITGDTWSKRQLIGVLNEINDEIANAYGGLFSSMEKESISVATITSGAVLGNLSQKLPSGTVKDLLGNKRKIQMSSDQIINGATIKAKKKNYGFNELFKITEKDHAKKLRVLISSGVAQGLTTKQIVKEFEIKNSQLSKGQVTSNIFTVIADSRNQGTYSAFNQLEQAGVIKYYEHVSVLDGNTSIHICVPRDGRKYFKPIDKISSFDKPPLHGNCRSRLVPRTGNELGDTRPSQFGEIPTTTYPQWFKQQSEQFQRSVLGKNKYNLYRSGDFKITTLADVKGKRMSLNTIESNLNSYLKG